VDADRAMMRAFGYEKAVVVGEYNAPWPNLYLEALAAMGEAMAAAMGSQPQREAGEDEPPVAFRRFGDDCLVLGSGGVSRAPGGSWVERR
jgi:hypothetical protein